MQPQIYLLCLLVVAIFPAHGVEINCNSPHEHYECGSACQVECQTVGRPCPVVNIRCNDACYCDEGYVRNDMGKCIPVEECP